MKPAWRTCSILAITAALLSSSCSKQTQTAGPAAGEKAAPQSKAESVLVSAAASTKEVIESLAEAFKSKTPAEIKINAGPSSGLANQIIAGAPADLFLSANQQWADEVTKASQSEASVRLLTNQLVIVVPHGNPAGVHNPADLLSPKVKKLALAGEQVPAGMYAEQSLTKLDLFKPLTDQNKIVRGQDVRSALTYVERGEAEAGIVYSTDVAVAPEVESVYQFDPASHSEIVYVLVLLKHGKQNADAKLFYDFLQSPAADSVYSKFGFSRLKP